MLSIQDITNIYLDDHDSNVNFNYRVKDEDIPSIETMKSLIPIKPIRPATWYDIFSLWFMNKHNDLPPKRIWDKQNQEAWKKLCNEINAVYFPLKKMSAAPFG
jgi:hypothetical protein